MIQSNSDLIDKIVDIQDIESLKKILITVYSHLTSKKVQKAPLQKFINSGLNVLDMDMT